MEWGSVIPAVDLSGEVALVTGASSGLGRHFALLLARAGAAVAMAARRLDRLEPLACDVTDSASVTAAVAAAEAALGPVTVLVNNSGVAVVAKPLEHDEADWD